MTMNSQSNRALYIVPDEPESTTQEAQERKLSYPLLRVMDLNVSIQGKKILHNINLQIPEKSITCIIGPSGCGKTTLLRSLNRLHDDQADIKISGSVMVDNEDIYGKNVEVTHIRKKMGLLAQRPTVLPMSIFDNVAYGPRIHGLRGRRKLYRIVRTQLMAVGLWEEVKDRLRSPAIRLSIGQQQRLCLARGLAVSPEIILGDEATSALDPIATTKIEELFLSLKQDYSIVLVTHTLRQAKRIADYVAFMYLGELIEFGTAQELFNNPQHPLTKDYIAGSFS
ncbi:MAG: phosphate ABC transporter ATP-binding protein [Marinilabiliales bacterium]|nr:phosphate ABC transporter ATP-binding protein [Marinilabiliales bacterium]